ncbi:MAG: hypothetical protein QG552_3982 [Thermodesulfobacteriota bacterium]|nr:hypothetical protein [Thermodesulfobacteriota bacterium]
MLQTVDYKGFGLKSSNFRLIHIIISIYYENFGLWSY